MNANPYAKKKTVFTQELIAKMAAENRAARIKRYPECANFGDVQADILTKPKISVTRLIKV